MPENTKNQVYEFGEGFRLDPLRRVLFGPDGAAIRLKPKVFDTLLNLVESGGIVLSKTELMRAVWGNLVVEENSLNKHVSTLRRVFGEKPGENRFIVTVPGRGYRFVATVRTTTQVESESRDARARSVEEARKTADNPPLAWLNRWYVLAGVAGAALLLVIAWSIRPAVTPTNTQTIAVLPFDDLSPDGDLEYFSDGMSIELTDLLGKVPNLRVIGRESAFWFKGRDATYVEIGEKLGASQLLEGTVQVANGQVRVTARLIDPGSAEQVWSYSPEARPISDVFAIQTEIATEVVARLRGALVDPVQVVDETTPVVYRDYLQAKHINRAQLLASMPRARELLEAAIETDPDYYPARYELGLTLQSLANAGVLSRPEMERLFRQTVSEAAAIWPDRPEVAASRAWIAFLYDGDYKTAARYYERALSLDPGNLDILMSAQPFAVALNRHDDAIAIGEYILARDPICYDCYGNLVRAYVVAERYDEAVETYETARALGFDHFALRLQYTMALLLRGDPAAVIREYEAPGWPEQFEPHRLFATAVALWDLQRMPEFEATFAALRRRSDAVIPLFVADVHNYIGDLDTAFEMFMSLPPSLMPITLFDGRRGDAIRQHPRWPELAKKAGIRPDPRDSIRFEFSLPE